MKTERFTVSFFSGSKRSGTWLAKLCEYCHASDPGASIFTFQGRHWKVLKVIAGFKTPEEAATAAAQLTE